MTVPTAPRADCPSESEYAESVASPDRMRNVELQPICRVESKRKAISPGRLAGDSATIALTSADPHQFCAIQTTHEISVRRRSVPLKQSKYDVPALIDFSSSFVCTTGSEEEVSLQH